MFEDPVSTYMKNWLNTTYLYLKETGGPTYPPVTVGIDVMPGGAFSSVEDYPINYGVVPLPFNPNATGIPATSSSQIDAIEEVAKQNPPPTIFSKNFGALFGDSMSACIADQEHRACNPNTISACRDLAETGDTSGIMLSQRHRNALGILPPSQENNKPDNVQLAENQESLTSQISGGVQAIKNTWTGFAAGLGRGLVEAPSGNKTITGDPAGVNFQSLSKRIQEFIPGMPQIPGTNTGSIVMIGGAVVLVVLLIAIVK
jgi:hypothetical protein